MAAKMPLACLLLGISFTCFAVLSRSPVPAVNASPPTSPVDEARMSQLLRLIRQQALSLKKDDLLRQPAMHGYSAHETVVVDFPAGEFGRTHEYPLGDEDVCRRQRIRRHLEARLGLFHQSRMLVSSKEHVPPRQSTGAAAALPSLSCSLRYYVTLRNFKYVNDR